MQQTFIKDSAGVLHITSHFHDGLVRSYLSGFRGEIDSEVVEVLGGVRKKIEFQIIPLSVMFPENAESDITLSESMIGGSIIAERGLNPCMSSEEFFLFSHFIDTACGGFSTLRIPVKGPKSTAFLAYVPVGRDESGNECDALLSIPSPLSRCFKTTGFAFVKKQE